MRLVQQLLTESMVLSFGGAVVGLALAGASVRFLASLEIPTDTPLVLGVQLDGRVFAFSLLVSVMGALLFGLAPAWQTARPDIVSALKAGGLDRSGRRPTRGRKLLVVS